VHTLVMMPSPRKDRDWKHAYKGLHAHVGGVNSAHNKARLHYGDFRNERQSVSRESKESTLLYKIPLHYSLGSARYLIAQGLTFCGYDESPTSLAFKKVPLHLTRVTSVRW
jgi:hypothetical protein